MSDLHEQGAAPRRLRYALAALGVVGVLAAAGLWWQRERAVSAPDTVELCGYGRIAPVRTIDGYPADVVKAADQVFTSIGADLRAQQAPRAQALGLYLQMVQSVREAGQDFERREKKCDDAACIQRRTQAAAEAAAPAAQALARLAASAQDATVYALAVYGCRLNQDGACGQLSKSRWAQRAPDNAVPWFWQAEEARARNDEAALIDALRQAARAKLSDYEWGAVLPVADHPQAQALAPASRIVLLNTLIGIYAAFPAPGYLAVTEACAEGRLTDPARRQVCDDLATMMTERSGSLMELALGTTLGERVGWPAERLQRLRDEKEAIYLLAVRDWQPDDIYSCRFLEQAESRVREFVTVGELRGGRQRIAASGQPASELAREWRELQRQRATGSAEAKATEAK